MHTFKLASVISTLIGLGFSQTFPVDNQVFRLTRADNGLQMDLEGGFRGEGAAVSQFNGYANDWGMYNQHWHLISGSRTNPTAFRIRNVRSNTYLTVGDGNTDNNAYVGCWERTGFANQTWFFQPEGEGTYRIVNQASGTCLTFGDETADEGVRVVGYDCATSAPNQRLFGLNQLSSTAADMLPILQSDPINAQHVARFVRGTKTIFDRVPIGLFERAYEFSANNGATLDVHYNGLTATGAMELEVAFQSSREMADVTTDLQYGTLLGYTTGNATDVFAYNFYYTEEGLSIYNPTTNQEVIVDSLVDLTVRTAIF